MLNPLLENVNAHFMPGWTGIVGANGCGKSTLLRLASGELEPTSGTIHQLGSSVYVLQRTDDPPEDWHEFLESDDFEADEWRRKLNISLDWHDRWDTLSHGERKRSQIAVALWKQPELLALDEPTNHIDANRQTISTRLRGVCSSTVSASSAVSACSSATTANFWTRSAANACSSSRRTP